MGICAVLKNILALISLLSFLNSGRENKALVEAKKDRDLSFQAYLKEREYLVKSEDDSERQLDQLIFYISSAAIGLTITQLASVTVYPELIFALLACLSFVLALGFTYASLRGSARVFESLREDADRVTGIPYVRSEKTRQLESIRFSNEQKQQKTFCAGLLFLLLFTVTKVIAICNPAFFPVAQTKTFDTPVVRKERIQEKPKMTDNEEKTSENNDQKKASVIREYSVKPKEPPPIKPVETKPTKDTEKK